MSEEEDVHIVYTQGRLAFLMSRFSIFLISYLPAHDWHRYFKPFH